MSKNESFLILGGAGLVGKQIAREIAKKLQPRKIVVAGLYQVEVDAALDELASQFEEVEWVGAWGNIFVRGDFAETSRPDLLNSTQNRDNLFQDLFGELHAAYENSYLVRLVRQHQPDVIIDSINTATAISYQDAHTASVIARREMEAAQMTETTHHALDVLMLSQALPQLVRHVQILNRAMVEIGTRLYLKVGTTGTGGMGLNIPYTHSEDKPSVKLMTKTAVAFAHTGLLFLMARTPDGPIVKEIKPGAMIGYADVSARAINERGKPVYLHTNRVQALNGKLKLHEDEYDQLERLELPVVDTGENGLFTRGEFEAITALRQMEFITPEEIARDAVLEIRGSNTGFDVIAEIDSAIMNPTYRAGYLRQQVLIDMNHLEDSSRTHSVALGQLGPPELSKLLWEVELLKIRFCTLTEVLGYSADELSAQVFELLQEREDLTQLMTSIGLPILLPDGKELIRGPFIRIPEIAGIDEVDLTPQNIDLWAAKGWVDLRPQNFAVWQKRFSVMQRTREEIRGRGSAAVSRQAYLFEDIRIGEIVGWIFNNEEDGYRIK